MNKQIRKLAEQSGASKLPGGELSFFGNDCIEKFAQLIVQECAEFANEHNEEIEGVTLGVGQALKKHFGVEE